MIKHGKTANKMSTEGVLSPSIFAVAQTTMRYTISITDNISDTFIYDEVLAVLENAEEQDEIIFNIASYGGHVSSLLSLRAGIMATRATVTGKLISHACSAAGMLLLSCHNKVVYPNTTFHAHTCSYGAFGKSDDIKTQVDFETNQIRKLVYDVYSGFLDAETEIPLLLNGKEFYFDADQTIERLQKYEQHKQQQLQAGQPPESLADVDLSQFSLEDLQEELEDMNEDRKVLQAEIKKRKQKTNI